MSTKHFDERQLANQRRATGVAFTVLLALVLVNGYITGSGAGAWTDPQTQALTLVAASTLVYAVQVLWTGAWFRGPRDARRTTAGFLVGAVWFGWSVLDAGDGIWQAGRPGPLFIVGLLAAWFCVVLVVGLARLVADAREEALA